MKPLVLGYYFCGKENTFINERFLFLHLLLFFAINYLAPFCPLLEKTYNSIPIFLIGMLLPDFKLVDPKGNVDQKIPLNLIAKDLLMTHKKPFPKSPYVFPGKDGTQRVSIKKPVNRIKNAAGLPKDFRPLHGLRHTYASMLASSGRVDIYTLQRLLTHKDPKVTQRYAHLVDEALKRGASANEELIRDLIKRPNKILRLNNNIATQYGEK